MIRQHYLFAVLVSYFYLWIVWKPSKLRSRRVLLCNLSTSFRSTNDFPAGEWRLSKSLLIQLQLLILHATPWLLVKACHMTHGARPQYCTLKWAASCRGGQRGFFPSLDSHPCQTSGSTLSSTLPPMPLTPPAEPGNNSNIYSRLRHNRAISNDQHQGDQTCYNLRLTRIIGVKKKAVMYSLLLIYQVQPKCGCTMCSDLSQVCRLLLFKVNK